MRNHLLAARWDGADLVVERDDEIVDRIAAAEIRRVALIDLGAEHVLLPAASGIAARIYFERQDWWTQRACIYWVTASHAPLPRHLRVGRSVISLLRRRRPAFLRLPAGELQALIEGWPLEGPQTWEQRKWRRIERSRPFGSSQAGALDSTPSRKRA